MQKINQILKYLDVKELRLAGAISDLCDLEYPKDKGAELYYSYETGLVTLETYDWDYHNRCARNVKKQSFPVNDRVKSYIKKYKLPQLLYNLKIRVKKDIMREMVDQRIKDLGFDNLES